MENKRAVTLLSGGLDSTTCLAIAKSLGFDIYALSIFYNQRHKIEMKAAKRVAQDLAVQKHLVLEAPLDRIGGSSLTSELAVPKNRSIDEMSEGIPSTYVPARNTIFLSYALAWAEVLGAGDIFIGVNAVDYSGYPDCRPEYIAAFEKMANLAVKKCVEGELRIKIHTPLITMSKGEIIRKGLSLGIDYGPTHSCYDPSESGKSCGDCDSCRLRAKGFADAGLADPADG